MFEMSSDCHADAFFSPVGFLAELNQPCDLLRKSRQEEVCEGGGRLVVVGEDPDGGEGGQPRRRGQPGERRVLPLPSRIKLKRR